MRRILPTLLLTAIATAFGQAGPDSSQASGPSVGERLDGVESQVKILKRLRENDIEDAAAVAAAAPKIQADGSGFWIRSADSSWQFRPRAIVRLGANWQLDNPGDNGSDIFQPQTIRFGFDASLTKAVDARFILDASKGNAAALKDGYFDLKFAPWAVARLGKFQVPLGLERFVSPSDLLFYDRALPSQIAPDRDVGAQLGGKLLKGAVEYAAGVFDGGADGTNIDKDANNDKDLYGRLWLVPAKSSGNEWFEGLGFGVGASGGYHSNAVPSAYKTTTSGVTFFSWNSTDSLQGTGYRISPQLSWTAQSFWLWGEWIHSQEGIYRGAATTTTDSVGTGAANKGLVYRTAKATTYLGPANLGQSAWQVGASWVVTGEDASASGGVKPRHPFGPDGWGALELAARVSGLEVDPDAFHGAAYADSTKSAKSALQYGAVAVWHIVRGTRLQFGYERTQFEEGASVNPSAKVKVVRDAKPDNELFAISSVSF
jgi:phosphate-selective porin OprO/OprP